MWCLFNILLFCVIVESSKVFKVRQKDPLVAYVYDAKGEDGQKIEKISDKKWSLLLQKLKESLHITGSKTQLNQFDDIKDSELQGIKPVLRMCTYDHPCKVKQVKKEDSCEKTKDECEEQKKDECEVKKDVCEEDSNECEEVKKCEEKKVDNCCNDKKKRKKRPRHYL